MVTSNRLRRDFVYWQNQRRLKRLTREIAEAAPQALSTATHSVVFFRASTGILQMSLNTAFSVLASMGLRLAGWPVVHFTCRSGMSRCVQGTRKENPHHPPPCRPCIAHSNLLYAHAQRHEFTYSQHEELARTLRRLDLPSMATFVYRGIPLGKLVMPSLWWVMRRTHLPDDEPTRYLAGEMILSAFQVAQQFTTLLKKANPQAVVVFNGILFPEATARWIAQQRGVRVITHEVGLRPMSAFFTEGEATAYPINIPADFELNSQQNARLDAYLEKRFQGQFTMAGIRFWPEMRRLDEDFLKRAAGFRQIVPVFTNVIFDTSQVHASAVFPDMFAWLEQVQQIIRAHPETLFVLRAHPDEMRINKESRETVHDWALANRLTELPNVLFIDSRQYLNSYELIQRAKFVMVYNSTIGLEASILGSAVLCGGKARYTQYPTVYFPQTPEAHKQQAETLLAAEKIDVPAEFQRQARRFLYYQLYRTSLPFNQYLEEGARPGFVKLRPFPWQELLAKNSPTMGVIIEGIVNGGNFLLPEG